MSQISKNIDLIQKRIIHTAHDVNRSPDQINLLAVSKTKPIEAITEAYQAGLVNFGENYLQEALQKNHYSVICPLYGIL